MNDSPSMPVRPKKYRVFIVPRRGATAQNDWYSWLAEQVRREAAHAVERVAALEMPNPQRPVPGQWVGKISRALGTVPPYLARSILVGHSVGCQALLRYLAALPRHRQVHGVLCVAGWWQLTSPWPGARVWLDHTFLAPHLRHCTRYLTCLISDNDPYTPDWQHNKLAWEQRLQARVEVVPGAAHFTYPREPAVLQALLTMLDTPL